MVQTEFSYQKQQIFMKYVCKMLGRIWIIAHVLGETGLRRKL